MIIMIVVDVCLLFNKRKKERTLSYNIKKSKNEDKINNPF